MQEEIENKAVNLVICTTKLTAKTIINAYNAWKRQQEIKSHQNPKGKQSLKELIGQNQGVTNIDISKTDLKGFRSIARKYGIDYAITKNKSTDPPQYMVFFKTKDADALTAAFKEFETQKENEQDKPSVIKKLHKLKEKLSQLVISDKIRHKNQERDL